MKLRLPSADELKALEERAKARRSAREGPARRRRNVRTLILLGIAAVALVALAADLRGLNHRIARFQKTGGNHVQGDAADIAAGLGEEARRFDDPKGLFHVIPPRHWKKVDKTEKNFFGAYWRGPYGLDMGVQVTVTNGVTFDVLVDRLRKIERGMAAQTHIQMAYVGGHRAVKRTVQLYQTKLLIFDFMTGDLMHHVQFGIPTAMFDDYEETLTRVMDGYQPGRILGDL